VAPKKEKNLGKKSEASAPLPQNYKGKRSIARPKKTSTHRAKGGESKRGGTEGRPASASTRRADAKGEKITSGKGNLKKLRPSAELRGAQGLPFSKRANRTSDDKNRTLGKCPDYERPISKIRLEKKSCGRLHQNYTPVQGKLKEIARELKNAGKETSRELGKEEYLQKGSLKNKGGKARKSRVWLGEKRESSSHHGGVLQEG